MNRDAQLGLLTRLKQERFSLRIEIDAAVKAIIFHFDPLDQDLMYTHNINPARLRVNVATIERKKKRLDQIQAEIHRLAKELDDSGD